MPSSQADRPHGGDGARVDLSNCDSEPIHIPGSIQPRGRLLVADRGGVLTHACATGFDELGGRRHLAEVLGADAYERLRFETVSPDRPHIYNAIETGSPAGLRAISAHCHEGRHLVEIEDVTMAREVDNLAGWLQARVADISQATSVDAMATVLTDAIHEVSGFDRAMVYRFDADWHGEVIAEAKGSLVSSYIGLHFPASDIPAQARALYTRQILRTIEDVNYVPVPLLALPGSDRRPVDLSYCGLRSVSPIHIEYLQNMGVAASLVVSLLIGDRLWGLLVCHHYAGPMSVAPRVRAIIQSVSFFASAQIGRLQQIETARMRAAAFQASEAFALQASSGRDFLVSVAAAFPALRDLFDVQAVVAQAPQGREAAGAVEAEGQGAIALPDELLVADRLPPAILKAAGCASEVVGGALITLDAQAGAFVLLGRVEEHRLVNWAGNPDKPALPSSNGDLRLHPRRSFELWQQEARGRSRSWTQAETEAVAVVAGRLRTGYALVLRRSAEDQLGRAQRLGAIGELTGGIAHDFNNILSAIIGNLELVVESEPAAVDRTLVKVALDAADRASTLTSYLLAFARRHALQPRAVALPGLVAQTMDLLRRTLDAAITLVAEIDPDTSLARVDPTLLESALINLVLNARDAMPKGGVIVIGAGNCTVDEELGRLLSLKPGAYVGMWVRDSGPGIPVGIRDRVFEPFFSTKPVGDGTGLGLSMVFGFAKQSGGSVEIDNAPGGGALLRILLPTADGEEAAREPGAAAVVPIDKGGHILLIEDQGDVGQTIARHLTVLGYTTDYVATAEAGLERLMAPGALYDVVITDIGLPGMGGVPLARQLRQHRPRLPVLLITGFATETQLAFLGQAERPFVLLRKPFRRRDLAEALRRAIATVPPSRADP